MKLYNTLTNKKENFEPIHPGKVGMYTCGPTVYGYIHIGNIRAYTNADILRRYLEYLGYEVRHIKNITDVGHLTDDDIAQGDTGEDKLIKKALKEKKTPEEIADFYENYFKEVEKEMNILPAQYFPKATAHVPQMIRIIKGLIEKEYAYEKNGNVFFDIEKFKDYGKLSGNTLENLKIGARLEEHPDKKNPWDFALWLKAPKGHLMKWESPWGIGYPGWHIECSAMSTEYLGETIDIHTGGEDNIFPHHEAEIAQSECYSGKQFSKYWFHGGMLQDNGEKMSKSKGNLYLLEDLKEKGYSAMDLRMLLLSSHYKSSLNFSWNAMDQAKKNLEKISEFIKKLKSVEPEELSEKGKFDNKKLGEYKDKFESAMDDNLNTPLALSAIYEMITEVNKLLSEKKISADQVQNILSFWVKINKVFGLILYNGIDEYIPEEIKKLAEKREDARKNKEFQRADELRDKLKEKGYEIKDLEGKYEIKKI